MGTGKRKERFLYPTMYNMVRVVNRMAETVRERGGRADPREEEVTVFFRDGNREVRSDVPAVTTRFVSLTSDLWIRFELDGFRYYFQVDDNPFFPDGYTKVPKDWNGRGYLDSIESGDKNWLTDGMFRTAVSETEIRHAADALLKYLEGAPDSCIHERQGGIEWT